MIMCEFIRQRSFSAFQRAFLTKVYDVAHYHRNPFRRSSARPYLTNFCKLHKAGRINLNSFSSLRGPIVYVASKRIPNKKIKAEFASCQIVYEATCKQRDAKETPEKTPRSLRSVSKENLDKWQKFSAETVRRKQAEMIRKGRCPTCWHHKASRCICSYLPPLKFLPEVKFYVYVHFTEWYNAGSSGKLLSLAAPEQTEIFVYGREGDDASFVQAIKKGGGFANALMLFPDRSAVTLAQFLRARDDTSGGDDDECGEEVTAASAVCHDKSAATSDKGTSSNNSNASATAKTRPLQVIVLDATWSRALTMMHHLTERVFVQPDSGGRDRKAETATTVTHVAIETDLVSVFNRKQTTKGRVCSVEAVALLLKEYGEDPRVCSRLIKYVEINNLVVKATPKKAIEEAVMKMNTDNTLRDDVFA